MKCALRVRCYTKYFKEIAALHKFSLKISRQADGLAAQHLKKQQCKNLKIYKFITAVVYKALLMFMYNPLRSYMANRELQSLLPIDIMFTDQTQLTGFTIANLIMALMVIYLVFASLFMSLHFYGLILNYSIQVDLIEFDIKQLDTFWSGTSSTSLIERHLFLRNICQKCQDKDE